MTERVYISKVTKVLLYTKQKHKCMYCGNTFSEHYLHIDHKTPVSDGGSNKPANLQLLCGPCNGRKGKLTDGEFRRKYKLPGSRTAKGPPSRPVSQKHFDAITKDRAKAKAKRRSSSDDFSFFS